MSVFLVVSNNLPAILPPNPDGIDGELSYYRVSEQTAAIASKKIVSPQEMYKTLGIQDGEHNSVLIVRFESYWGYHDTSLWDWMAKQGM